MRNVFCVALLLLFASRSLIGAETSTSKAEISAPKKITTVEGVTEYRLDNG
jgi:hypothetical protein